MWGRGGITVCALVSRTSVPSSSPGARFSKAFGPVNPFSDHLYPKNEEVYTPETSCVKVTSLHQWLYGPEKFPGLSRNGPLASDILLRSWTRHYSHSASLHPVYKCVPANLMVVILRWTSIPSRGEGEVNLSCFMPQKPG